MLRTLVCSSIVCALIVGCSTTRYKESADREAYGIIAEKGTDVPNLPSEFSIEDPPSVSLAAFPVKEETEEYLGEAADIELGAAVIGLEEALYLAVNYNRTYRNRKEVLYLNALRLSLERHRYSPIFGAGVRGTYRRTTRDQAVPSPANQATTILAQLGELTGTPASMLQDYALLIREAGAVTGLDQPGVRIIDERSTDLRTSVGVDLLLAGGARIAMDLTSNFLQFLTGDPRISRSSTLAGTITQPLLRGAGSAIAQEQLTQAERNMLYGLRDFAQFRKSFTVDIAANYYEVLQSRDRVRNAWELLQSRQRDAERQEALAEAERISGAQVGQQSQALLEANNSWIAAVQAYGRSLDNFKIQLGLPTDAAIVLDDEELDALQERGLIHPQFTGEEAIEVALAARMDFYNVRDEVDDAERRVMVAANQLKPRLDFIATASVDSEDNNRYRNFDFDRAIWSAGLDLDLPLDQKSPRNNYRTSLIDLAQASRSLELFEDQVKLQVRQAWRDLEQARRSFEIRLEGVALNERRVEEEQLKLLAGRGTARDRIEAENDLVNAQNALVDALITHTLARLRLYRDMGILFIKEDGRWEIVDEDDGFGEGVDTQGLEADEPPLMESESGGGVDRADRGPASVSGRASVNRGTARLPGDPRTAANPGT